jgi:hypothetical protein
VVLICDADAEGNRHSRRRRERSTTRRFLISRIYLHEAVTRKHEAVTRKREALGGRLTRAALLEAVQEGAVLRLRPKVMTVAAVVASLLPIMWSYSTGAEVMKPLAKELLPEHRARYESPAHEPGVIRLDTTDR